MKNTSTSLILGFLCVLLIVSCKKQPSSGSGCDQVPVISAQEFQNAPNNDFTLQSLQITGDCLQVKFTSGGCDGSTWKVQLIDVGGIAESLPPQRTLRLSLENKELCYALITKSISFDLRPLRIAGARSVILNVSGKSILYEY